MFVEEGEVGLLMELEISASCQGEIHPLAVEGIRLFNAHRFFEAHEELELAWMEERGPVRELYRGILQIAVAYYHIQRGNHRGAAKMFQRSWRWLAPFPARCRGIAVAELIAHARASEELLLRLGPDRISHFPAAAFKPIDLPTSRNESSREEPS
jgi:predicted metal-dependent hydrolase